jgi:hypothetical protein
VRASDADEIIDDRIDILQRRDGLKFRRSNVKTHKRAGQALSTGVAMREHDGSQADERASPEGCNRRECGGDVDHRAEREERMLFRRLRIHFRRRLADGTGELLGRQAFGDGALVLCSDGHDIFRFQGCSLWGW